MGKPLLNASGTVVLRAARVPEIDRINRLILASKRTWGYSDAFAAAVGEDLRLDKEAVTCGRAIVAVEGFDLAGICAWSGRSRDGTAELSHLFVAPGRLRRGIGTVLITAVVAAARCQGVRQFTIEADPNAAAFYLQLGAEAGGERVLSHDPERRLALLTLDFEKFHGRR